MVQCYRHVAAAMLVLGMAAVPSVTGAAAPTAEPSDVREPERQEDARQFGNRLDGQIAGVCPVPGDGPPIGGPGDRAPLPHTRQRLAEGGPLVILAIGSSSTQGYGAPRPEASYPFRLERDLARRYPDSRIQVINAGVGGEIAADQLARLDKLLADNRPDLVIWQAGTNDALRAVDRVRFAGEVRDGLARIRTHGADALLMDLQVYPGARDPETYAAYVALMRRLATETATPLYSRFDLMTAWENDRANPSPDLLFTDRFHLNTIGYACIARALGSAIARAVGQASAGQASASATVSAPALPAGSDQRMARKPPDDRWPD
ncbi:SGNH/GDSL hydrolase family protein [Tistrella bauzanensis]